MMARQQLLDFAKKHVREPVGRMQRDFFHHAPGFRQREAARFTGRIDG
jgi:hypothetical protein